LRHPKTTIPMLWSHHEKIVIIDKKVGFLGGIDLCYGRYDNQRHLLFDLDNAD
jgi:phospholipase D1/2